MRCTLRSILLAFIFASPPAVAEGYVIRYANFGKSSDNDTFVMRNGDSDSEFVSSVKRSSLFVGVKYGSRAGIEAAVEYSFSGLTGLLGSIGVGYAQFTASGINLLAFYRKHEWEFGAGVAYYPWPRAERINGNGVLRDTVEFEGALGRVLKIESHFGKALQRYVGPMVVGIRYEDAEFTTEQTLEFRDGGTGRTLDGERTVMTVGWEFR